MTATRRDLENAARRRFIFGAAGGMDCGVDRCDRPGAAIDIERDDGLCLLHILERIGLIASFPAYASLPSKVLPQRACEVCGEPATDQIVMDLREYSIETRMGGGSQHEWPVCREHVRFFPTWVENKPRVFSCELREAASEPEPTS